MDGWMRTYTNTVVDAEKVKLSKVSWMMPRIQPNDEMKYELDKSIESKSILDAALRMRHVILLKYRNL